MKHYVSATKPNRLMLFRETAAVYCENHTEHIYRLRVQNSEFLNVEPGGKFINHCTSKWMSRRIRTWTKMTDSIKSEITLLVLFQATYFNYDWRYLGEPSSLCNQPYAQSEMKPAAYTVCDNVLFYFTVNATIFVCLLCYIQHYMFRSKWIIFRWWRFYIIFRL
jgi:hypothetical protein